MIKFFPHSITLVFPQDIFSKIEAILGTKLAIVKIKNTTKEYETQGKTEELAQIGGDQKLNITCNPGKDTEPEGGKVILLASWQNLNGWI